MGTLPAMPQETNEKDIALEEVQIEALSNRSIINKAIGNLHKRTKESISLCNGQLTQIMEADGKVVQLSREYGYYISSSYYEKMRNKFDGFWHSNFVPVYNACSLRYALDGKTVLPASYSYPEETYPWTASLRLTATRSPTKSSGAPSSCLSSTALAHWAPTSKA